MRIERPLFTLRAGLHLCFCVIRCLGSSKYLFYRDGGGARHDWHEYTSAAPGRKLKAFEVWMSPLGQTLESGFSIVKVLSVGSLPPRGASF